MYRLEQVGTSQCIDWNRLEPHSVQIGTGWNLTVYRLEQVGTSQCIDWNRLEPHSVQIGTGWNLTVQCV